MAESRAGLITKLEAVLAAIDDIEGAPSYGAVTSNVNAARSEVQRALASLRKIGS